MSIQSPPNTEGRRATAARRSHSSRTRRRRALALRRPFASAASGRCGVAASYREQPRGPEAIAWLRLSVSSCPRVSGGRRNRYCSACPAASSDLPRLHGVEPGTDRPGPSAVRTADCRSRARPWVCRGRSARRRPPGTASPVAPAVSSSKALGRGDGVGVNAGVGSSNGTEPGLIEPPRRFDRTIYIRARPGCTLRGRGSLCLGVSGRPSSRGSRARWHRERWGSRRGRVGSRAG